MSSRLLDEGLAAAVAVGVVGTVVFTTRSAGHSGDHRPGTPTLRVVTHSLHQGNLARPIASRATDGLAPADDTHVLRRS